MENLRLRKIGEQYQHAVSHLLLDDMEDPNLRGVQVTRVLLTADLSIARVYFTAGTSAASVPQILKSFKKAQGFLKREVSARVTLKYTPRFEFYYDERLDLTESVDELFKKIDAQKNPRPE